MKSETKIQLFLDALQQAMGKDIAQDAAIDKSLLATQLHELREGGISKLKDEAALMETINTQFHVMGENTQTVLDTWLPPKTHDGMPMEGDRSQRIIVPEGYTVHYLKKERSNAVLAWLNMALGWFYRILYSGRCTLAMLITWLDKNLAASATNLSIAAIVTVGLRFILQAYLLIKRWRDFERDGIIIVKLLQLALTLTTMISLICFLLLSQPIVLLFVVLFSTVVELMLDFSIQALSAQHLENKNFFYRMGVAILDQMRPKDKHNKDHIWQVALFWSSMAVSIAFIVTATLSLFGISFLGPAAMLASLILGVIVLTRGTYHLIKKENKLHNLSRELHPKSAKGVHPPPPAMRDERPSSQAGQNRTKKLGSAPGLARRDGRGDESESG